jgi:hypothetical protein
MGNRFRRKYVSLKTIEPKTRRGKRVRSKWNNQANEDLYYQIKK